MLGQANTETLILHILICKLFQHTKAIHSKINFSHYVWLPSKSSWKKFSGYEKLTVGGENKEFMWHLSMKMSRKKHIRFSSLNTRRLKEINLAGHRHQNFVIIKSLQLSLRFYHRRNKLGCTWLQGNPGPSTVDKTIKKSSVWNVENVSVSLSGYWSFLWSKYFMKVCCVALQKADEVMKENEKKKFQR